MNARALFVPLFLTHYFKTLLRKIFDLKTAQTMTKIWVVCVSTGG